MHPEIWAFRWESQLFSGLPGLCDLLMPNANEARILDQFRVRALTHLFERQSKAGSYSAGFHELFDREDYTAIIELFCTKFAKADTVEERKQACVELIECLFRPHADKASAMFWCEKTPRNLLFADSIHALLPSAKFIHVLRDGRDVAASIMRKGFWPIARSARFPETSEFFGRPTFPAAGRYWHALLQIEERIKSRIPAELWLDVRIEDCVADSKAPLLRICEFLQVSTPDSFSEAARNTLTASALHQGAHMVALSRQQIAMIEKFSMDSLKRFKYI